MVLGSRHTPGDVARWVDVVANARNRSKRRIECLEIAVWESRTRVGYGRVFQFKMVQNALDLLRLDLISNKNPISNK